MDNNAKKKIRSSNLELFRIITMIMIVAHHYVVNSGLTDINGPIYSALLSPKSLFLLIFGAWGKIGINCFILITGYFMCKSNITVKKFAKLLFEIMFYRIIINLIFLIFGYVQFNWIEFFKMLFPVINLGTDFTQAFVVFYLFIPFINKFIHNISEKQHLKVIALCLTTYVFLGTFPLFSVTMNYLSWYIVLYLISSYIRIYPKKTFKNKKYWGRMLFASVILSILSVIVGAWLSSQLDLRLVYYFVSDSNTFLAVITAISAFMYFLNLDIKNNKYINTVAASTFGVLLIHAHSDTMRQWLWGYTLNNTEMYYSEWLYIHAIISVITVYVICTFIDYLRIQTIEKAYFKFWDKIEDSITYMFYNLESKVSEKLNI